MKKTVRRRKILQYNYYAYMSEKTYKKVEHIIEKIASASVTEEYMSWKTYYANKKRAIETLCTIRPGLATQMPNKRVIVTNAANS